MPRTIETNKSLPSNVVEPNGVPVAQITTAHAWNEWSAKLDACRSLQDGWNGYTAAAPSTIAIENARSFLDVMQKVQFEPTRLAPSAMAGVAITRKAADKKVLVEFYNDGRVFALFSKRPDEMRVVPVAADSDSFRAFIAEMREYLNG